MSQTIAQRLALARVTKADKLAEAKRILGSRWLLHPDNRVQRKTPFTWRSNHAA